MMVRWHRVTLFQNQILRLAVCRGVCEHASMCGHAPLSPTPSNNFASFSYTGYVTVLQYSRCGLKSHTRVSLSRVSNDLRRRPYARTLNCLLYLLVLMCVCRTSTSRLWWHPGPYLLLLSPTSDLPYYIHSVGFFYRGAALYISPRTLNKFHLPQSCPVLQVIQIFNEILVVFLILDCLKYLCVVCKQLDIAFDFVWHVVNEK